MAFIGMVFDIATPCRVLAPDFGLAHATSTTQSKRQ